MAKPRRIEQTYYYGAAPEKVFAALTEPDELVKWFVEKAVLRPRKGAPFRFTWGTYTLRGKVRTVEPPHRIVLDWIDRFPGGRVFETVARFDLKKRGKGTLLTITHRGFKSGRKWTELYGAISSGWAYYLLNLRSVLEHGTDLRSRSDEL